MQWSTDTATEHDRTQLTGRNVRLRGLRDSDLAQLAAWWQDPSLGVLQMTTVAPPSEAAARGLFSRWSENQNDGVGFSIETVADERLIGHLTIFGVRARNRSATFAIGLGPDQVGRGLGSEAVRLAVHYAFTELNLHRLQLTAMALNERALTAYRKAGFIEEGRNREAVFHAGQCHDEVRMAILETDPRPAV